MSSESSTVNNISLPSMNQSPDAASSLVARERSLRHTHSQPYNNDGTNTFAQRSRSPPQPLSRRSHSERVSQHRSDLDHDLPPLPRTDMSPEARRQTMIAMDRKRRLTASALHENGRRRTTTGGFTSRDNRYYNTASRRDSQQSHQSSAAGPATTNTNNATEQPEVIDLTVSSPPAPTLRPTLSGDPTRSQRTPSNGSRGHVVPKWQPDHEASICPICHRQFGFLFRRHHCRKCGRVVCNDCSPHRITIPRQYIVHPPGAIETSPSAVDAPTIDLTRSDTDGEDRYVGLPSPYRRNSALGGGEKVRLCNPCVPDPQPDLQAYLREPLQNRDLFSGGNSEQPQRAPPSTLTTFPQFRYPQGLVAAGLNEGERRFYDRLPHPGTRVHLNADEDGDDSGSSPEAYTNAPRRHIMGMSSSRYDRAVAPMHSRFYSLDSRQAPLPPLPPFSSRPRGSSLMDPFRSYYSGSNAGMPPPFSPLQPQSGVPSHASTNTSSAPRPQRRRIREEDMCPICRGELPSKGPDGDETDREAHIMECITQHESTPRQSAATQSQPNLAAHLTQPPTQTQTRPIQFGASGPTLPISTPSNIPPFPPPPDMPFGPSSSSAPSRPAQMVRFTATEKDCTPQPNADGTLDTSTVECSICMVEYEVGERLVRLECWCKFHQECIVEWFGRRAECPVHKIS